MSKLSKLMKSAVNAGGGVTRGLEKIKLDELIKRYDGVVTINGMDRVPYEGSYFYVFTFAEDPGACFSGGMALTQIGDALFEGYDGDIEAINVDLQAQPQRVKMKKIKTKSRRDFTQVTLLSAADADEPAHDAQTGEVRDGLDFGDNPF